MKVAFENEYESEQDLALVVFIAEFELERLGFRASTPENKRLLEQTGSSGGHSLEASLRTIRQRAEAISGMLNGEKRLRSKYTLLCCIVVLLNPEIAP